MVLFIVPALSIKKARSDSSDIHTESNDCTYIPDRRTTVSYTHLIKSPTNLHGIPRQGDTPLYIILHHVHPDTIPTVHLIREIENQYIISLETPPSGHPVDSDILIIQSCKHIEQASPPYHLIDQYPVAILQCRFHRIRRYPE